MASVLVTGGTGRLGARIVAHLAARGHSIRVLSRTRGSDAPRGVEEVVGDLASGEGLTSAVAGIDTVIHAASDSSDPMATDVAGTRRLIVALGEGGDAAKLVYVSIVGVEHSRLPYYVAKRAVEREVESSGLAWSIVRATQFHSFALSVLQSLVDDRGTLTVPDGTLLQPVDADEVAERLVAVADGQPLRRIALLGGPEVLSLEHMARAYQETRGLPASVRVGVVHDPMLDAWQSRDQLTPEHAEGRLTWQQFLDR
ncbi:MAG: NmrA family NAD(P)-binding protein [Candidatus Dormibacteraeota bacterium]|uniref:NmrA family NAD(P)-binding protein n=1 Tax=Candidatus Aeolococcus gillhamiae TaxID=3127015 RepID=A0A2W5Z3M3_9BACT|nr:NmrA family NAD(P)-binding protein [Candidatus Dormibacteraeota bacterium]PZR79823.1 MAG: dTDP-4-dehydrorhamnose reductase [Candidatus Dormibacter sp. RRmetagenome_bin12]